jgi:hypothetical protein
MSQIPNGAEEMSWPDVAWMRVSTKGPALDGREYEGRLETGIRV